MAGVQKTIKRIMSKPKEERETKLRELAQKLGCSLSSTYSAERDKHLEHELIRRIQDADRSIREHHLWWIAVLASIAAVVSALAAWSAVLSS